MSDTRVANLPTDMRLRQALLLAGVLLVPVIPSAHAAEARLRASMEDCAAVRDDAARLACFEALVEQPQVEAPPAPATTTREVAPASRPLATLPETSGGNAAADEEDFGLEHKAAEPDEEVRDEDAVRYFTVVDARHNDFTGWTIEFENGQVWRQVGTQRYDIEVGQTYSVQRASFNSFLLGNADNNRKIRVTRVR